MQGYEREGMAIYLVAPPGNDRIPPPAIHPPIGTHIIQLNTNTEIDTNTGQQTHQHIEISTHVALKLAHYARYWVLLRYCNIRWMSEY